jgi:predicted porin
MRPIRLLRGPLLPVLALLLATPALAEDARVDALIQRLEAQEREIQTLRQEVQELRQGVVHAAEHPEYRREDGQYPVSNYDAPRIRLDIAGQINQAFTAAGDGRQTKGYFVDNDASGSRIRFAGVSTFDESWDLGSTLEVAFSPNNSFDVDQDNERAGDFLQVRRAELWVRDDRFGRLLFGQGSAAADNTAEFDLSLVSGPIMTSGVEFTYGGLQFTDGDRLTGIAIADAFFNFDGNRQGRVRYDSPMFGPAQLSISAGSDQRYDAALTFGGDYDSWSGVDLPGFTALGGVSISRPNDGDENYRLAGSASLLHDASGVSLTVSSGFDGGTRGDTPYGVYGKLGWDTQLVRFGPTGFGLDYVWNENLSADDDQGQSLGVAAVQVLQDYGIEIYTQFRWFTVDRDEGPSFDDILLGTLGTRIRF